MTKLELKEKYKVNDFHSKVRGIVTVTNLNNGKVLFTKENTVVEKGRNLLLNRLFGNISSPSFSFYMSKEGNVEQYSDTFETVSADNKLIFKKDLEELSGNFLVANEISESSENTTAVSFALEKEANNIERSAVTNHIQVLINPDHIDLESDEFLINPDPDNIDLENDEFLRYETAKSAGLIFTLDSGEHYELFSRVTFEGITLKANAKYLIDYYIYF